MLPCPLIGQREFIVSLGFKGLAHQPLPQPGLCRGNVPKLAIAAADCEPRSIRSVHRLSSLVEIEGTRAIPTDFEHPSPKIAGQTAGDFESVIALHLLQCI